MSKKNKQKSEFLDGALQSMSFFCGDNDFIPYYGALQLMKGSVNDNSLLIQALDSHHKETHIESSREVVWHECLNILFEKWVTQRLTNHLNTSKPQGGPSDLEMTSEALYDFLYEAIEWKQVPTNFKAKYIKMDGEGWEYDAECLVIEDDDECYALYFMHSD